MDISDDDSPEGGPEGGNAHEFTVSELSGAVKRVIEGEFGRVRVRGEIGRVSRPASGHVYFDLKDDRAVIAAIAWKGQAARFRTAPEEGLEVIATGRLTTFPGQSKYQLVVDDIAPAGQGALMLMLERLKARLAAEGLFAPEAKRPIPYLPQVIGVVTSPSGAVIRDILHRLRERFPRQVLIWPVAVQGEKCASEVAAAIRGFNALAPGGPVPRPDLIIVARGGGSIEDLWGFNEEIVVRAAAESTIPLISAVGHETDTTLIDHAADRRAPTPTAAAEMAVPVRADLLVWSADQGARLARAARRAALIRRQRLADLGRALGRPAGLIQPARQRHDFWSDRLGPALGSAATRKRAGFNNSAARLRGGLLESYITLRQRRLADWAARLRPALLSRLDRQRERLAGQTGRLAPALLRQSRETVRRRDELARSGGRLAGAMQGRLDAGRDRLERLDRLRQTLGYTETLRRGFAVVRAGDAVVTSAARAARCAQLEVEFGDGRLALRPAPPAAPHRAREVPPEDGQGRLI